MQDKGACDVWSPRKMVSSRGAGLGWGWLVLLGLEAYTLNIMKHFL